MLPAIAKVCLSLCFRLQTTAYFRPTEIPCPPHAPCLTLSFLKFNTLPGDHANGDSKFLEASGPEQIPHLCMSSLCLAVH